MTIYSRVYGRMPEFPVRPLFYSERPNWAHANDQVRNAPKEILCALCRERFGPDFFTLWRRLYGERRPACDACIAEKKRQGVDPYAGMT